MVAPCDQFVHSSLIGRWLGSGVVFTEVNFFSPLVPKGLGLCAHSHQVINIFHLVGGFHICKTTQEMCIKYCHRLTHLREELLKQRVWRKSLSQEGTTGSCVYVLVAELCPILCDPIDCSSSVHRIL